MGGIGALNEKVRIEVAATRISLRHHFPARRGSPRRSGPRSAARRQGGRALGAEDVDGRRSGIASHASRHELHLLPRERVEGPRFQGDRHRLFEARREGRLLRRQGREGASSPIPRELPCKLVTNEAGNFFSGDAG